MVEKTVEIGDTEVRVSETDDGDGFEATAVEQNDLAQYVRANVAIARSHEEVEAKTDKKVWIVDTDNNRLSPRTFIDIVEDDKISLGAVTVRDGNLRIAIRSGQGWTKRQAEMID